MEEIVVSSQKTILIKPRSFLIEDDTSGSSYWAMFYSAILKTVFYQKNLDYRFNVPSLQSYRGELKKPSNFFKEIKNKIKNHGFEYLMVDFLRSVDGADIRDTLIKNLLGKYGINDFEYNLVNVFKLGNDSELYDEIKKYQDPEVKVFIPKGKHVQITNRTSVDGFTYNVSKIAEAFQHSDLLIMISDGRNHTYGFVGEVEGGHGETLFREKYWDTDSIKGRHTTFAIGASERKKHLGNIPVKENIVLHEDAEGRFILHFSNATDFYKCYLQAVSIIELYLDGHYANVKNLGPDVSHSKVLKIIEDGWADPLPELLKKLDSLIEYDVDIEEFHYQRSTGPDVTYSPSLIALENEYFLHKIKRKE